MGGRRRTGGLLIAGMLALAGCGDGGDRQVTAADPTTTTVETRSSEVEAPTTAGPATTAAPTPGSPTTVRPTSTRPPVREASTTSPATARPAKPIGTSTTAAPTTRATSGTTSATTTTSAPDAAPGPATAVSDDAVLGVRLTLGVTDAEVAQGARAEVTFTVENRSQQHVLYNASPGPRLRMRAGDKVVWDGGCGMAYPAVYSERTLAPGERVEYRATYPVADAARDAECRPAPGSYELTGWFQGCKRGPADPSGVTGYRCETEMTTVEARPITFRQR